MARPELLGSVVFSAFNGNFNTLTIKVHGVGRVLFQVNIAPRALCRGQALSGARAAQAHKGSFGALHFAHAACTPEELLGEEFGAALSLGHEQNAFEVIGQNLFPGSNRSRGHVHAVSLFHITGIHCVGARRVRGRRHGTLFITLNLAGVIDFGQEEKHCNLALILVTVARVEQE